jgi:hypothetical protein
MYFIVFKKTGKNLVSIWNFAPAGEALKMVL